MAEAPVDAAAACICICSPSNNFLPTSLDLDTIALVLALLATACPLPIPRDGEGEALINSWKLKKSTEDRLPFPPPLGIPLKSDRSVVSLSFRPSVGLGMGKGAGGNSREGVAAAGGTDAIEMLCKPQPSDLDTAISAPILDMLDVKLLSPPLDRDDTSPKDEPATAIGTPSCVEGS